MTDTELFDWLDQRKDVTIDGPEQWVFTPQGWEQGYWVIYDERVQLGRGKTLREAVENAAKEETNAA